MKKVILSIAALSFLASLTMSCNKTRDWECKCYDDAGSIGFHVSFLDAQKSDAKDKCNQYDKEFQNSGLDCKLTKE